MSEVHMPGTTYCGNTTSQTAIRVRVGSNELQASASVLDGNILAVAHFEIQSQGGGGINASQIPGIRPTLQVK